ncbi:MAG: hypothetical protein SF029_25685 [bacterium]|nr:hypothetical protein [bacterium]
MSNHFRQWSQLAPRGLLLIGAGVSLIGDAIIRKGEDRGWFWRGTLGLILLNAGLAVFGDAIKHRALYEMKTGDL